MLKNKWIGSMMFTLKLTITFIIALFLTYFVRYGEVIDTKLFTQFYLIIILINVIPMLFGLKIFGIIVYCGAVIGLLVDCLTSYLEQGHPTMQGGIYNLLIVALSFIIAIVSLVIFSKRQESKISKQG